MEELGENPHIYLAARLFLHKEAEERWVCFGAFGHAVMA